MKFSSILSSVSGCEKQIELVGLSEVAFDNSDPTQGCFGLPELLHVLGDLWDDLANDQRWDVESFKPVDDAIDGLVQGAVESRGESRGWRDVAVPRKDKLLDDEADDLVEKTGYLWG